jgi:tetratricopeptide (TPR) repeat protein
VEASVGTAVPDPAGLGYQAALETGLAYAEFGASAVAVTYFDRALALRPTTIAHTNRGRCLRDLGRLDEAEVTYRQALDIDAHAGYALVGLVAVLCDLRRYEEALPLARQAAVDQPENPAALTVAARCLDEFADVISRSESASPDHVSVVKRQAKELRERALALEPVPQADSLRRLRGRVFVGHSLVAPSLTDAEETDAGRDPCPSSGAESTPERPSSNHFWRRVSALVRRWI